MNPIFPLTTPPTCRRCGHLSIRRIVNEDNRNGNADRPYFSCMDGCHPNTSEFVSWDDYGGIRADNPPCWCNGNFPSRRNKTNKEPRRYFYKCSVGWCEFFAWGGEVEERDGWGGGGGGGGFPGSGANGAYLKVEETQVEWSGAASSSGHATYARPGVDTQMDHDSTYGSQAAGPSVHAVHTRPDFGRQIETQVNRGETVASVPVGPTVSAGPKAARQMEETRSNAIRAASSNGLAMHPHPSQSLQRQTEETPNISAVTAGVPVYKVAGKSGDISISSMEEGFGVKFGATSRRRCCGICAVM